MNTNMPKDSEVPDWLKEAGVEDLDTIAKACEEQKKESQVSQANTTANLEL